MLFHILSALVDINQQLQIGNPSTDASQSLNQVLAKLSQIVGHNAMAIIVSDGNGWNQQSTDLIKRIRAHNEVIACHISDPLEQQLPKMSQMVVSDGQMQIQFSSEKKKIHQQYQNQVEQQMGRFVETSRKYRIPLISINTIEPADLQLRKALGQVKP